MKKYRLELNKGEFEQLKNILYKEYISILDNNKMLDWAKEQSLKDIENLCKIVNKEV